MPTIFLSSTFVDLAVIRKELSHWLSQVFGVDLVIMETFGSDAAPPHVMSVRKVRECDIFVGIYAHRYGTIDPTSGKSITELELDEAERAHSAGIVRDLLLYLHDEKSPWPPEHRENNEVASRKLAHLRERAKSHTCSYFGAANELLLAVMRDLHRKLAEHFDTSPLQIRELVLQTAIKLQRPAGMEFLGSAQRAYLIGRRPKLSELVERIEANPLLLLLGDSGIGKTSLINAGLIPVSLEKGWRPVYTRPLGLPSADVVHQIQGAVFRGRPSYRGPLLPFLGEITELVPEAQLLLIIDQFEDVLVARSQQEVDALVADLRGIYQSPPPRLRVVVSYRADLEGRLGECWQSISGSAAGLPRVYLDGLSVDDVPDGVSRTAEALNISLNLDEQNWQSIRRDLALTSTALGMTNVYPPYVQMLIEHIWNATAQGRSLYDAQEYQRARGLDGIVGDYLTRQLGYAEDPAGHVRLVLIALVRSYGVKAQKRLEELISETGLDERQAEIALEKLIDLRLVRHIEQYYEISHDFIARKIVSELVDSEEKEFKRFRELLSSKGAAFTATGAPLTSHELLLLYKHRERILPSEQELRLLFESWLEGEGPALYWLMNPEWKPQVLSWISSELKSEEMGQEGRDRKAAAALLKLRIEEGRIAKEDFAALKRYEYTIELASALKRDAANLTEELILAGLRHLRGEVRGVCKGIVATRLRAGQWSLLPKMRNSAAKHFWEAYVELVTERDVPVPPADGSRHIDEFRNLKTITFGADEDASTKAYSRLRAMRPQRRSLLLGASLLAIRCGRTSELLLALKSRPRRDAAAMLGAFAGNLKRSDFRALVAAYEAWNKSEPEEQRTAPAVYRKARALADAVAHGMRPDLASVLRTAVKRVRLTDSARAIVLALLKRGQIEDVKVVLKRIALEKSKVTFWTHTELAQAVARRMAEVQEGVPDFLLAIIKKQEFRHYDPDEEVDAKEQLQLQSPENRSLYIRLAAYAAIGCAATKDVGCLLELTTHDYTLIARAAAIRLVHLLGGSALTRLSSAIKVDISERQRESLAGAIRFAEIEHYGVANVW
jgi:hypothetical protein